MARKVLLAAYFVAASTTTAAAEGNCTTVDLDLLPATLAANPFSPQIVAWVESPAGVYVDTAFITQQTGSFGIGNRPGRYDFNSGPNWPYGRRVTTFPVWAHRHGLQWDEVVFQNDDDSNLSHPFDQSSVENHFCRPLQRDEPSWDAYSCASRVFTDKGLFSTVGNKSLYPPRADLEAANQDDPVVDMFDLLNPFDTVSQATPPAGTLATLSWPVPETLPFGDYVMFVEVSREFDTNSTYNTSVFPAPTGIPWMEYGEPYRGQPSVVYRIPFTILADGTTTASTAEYVGYGDPEGIDGNLRAPDNTITSDVPGSGAARLQLISVDGETFRLRLTSRPQVDFEPPALPAEAQVVDVTGNEAQLTFVAPGDDGTTGKVKKYEIRYRVGQPMTPESFDTATLVATSIRPSVAGAVQTFTLPGLLPSTEYSVGIRAIDDCRNISELAIVELRTPDRGVGEVDACFVATAAYGSVLAGDVDLLRRFRDLALRKTAFGELAVEAYYTFGPALSGLIGESDLLRSTARDALAPVVSRVRGFQVSE
ncbi:MAG: fibronectin type III domain-containing protein [Deltaproteobacteria bacterium]|nr:fibronectin type III domain-containing protein [Deltaproteobacteria bacterium]